MHLYHRLNNNIQPYHGIIMLKYYFIQPQKPQMEKSYLFCNYKPARYDIDGIQLVIYFHIIYIYIDSYIYIYIYKSNKIKHADAVFCVISIGNAVIRIHITTLSIQYSSLTIYSTVLITSNEKFSTPCSLIALCTGISSTASSCCFHIFLLLFVEPIYILPLVSVILSIYPVDTSEQIDI